MSAPSKTIAPPEIGYCPTIARNRLVLPTPLRPSTHVTLPGSAEIETPRHACAAPQIHFRPPFVRRHLVDGALGQYRALMQTGHLDAEFADESHVVLDDHHG